MLTSEMAKYHKRENKEPRGVGLSPSVWARIEAVAENQEKSLSQVIEDVLTLHLPVVRDFRKSEQEPQLVASIMTAEPSVIDDAPLT